MPVCVQRMTKFRVKMDMSQFYDDERNLVYILVDPKWEQVLRLEEHVQQLFDVPKVHFLADDDVHIPSGESIEIIKSNDVLRAIIPERKRRKKRIKDDGFGDVADAEEEVETVNRKHTDERPLCSTPHEQPRKKQRRSMNATNLKTFTEEDQSVQAMLGLYSPQSQSEQSSSRHTESSGESSGLGKPEEQEQRVTFVHPTDEETVKTRKRKRGRKKKALTAKSPRLSSVPVPISSSTVRLSKSLRTPRRHTHFDDSPTLVEQDSAGKTESIVYRCQLSMEDAWEPREIEAEEIEEGAPPSKKPKILIHENLVLVGARDVSTDGHNETSVIEVDDTVVRPEPEQEEDHQATSDSNKDLSPRISIEEILPLSEPLVDMPQVGEIILFKMYRLNEGITPGVTDYICGRCEQVNSINGTMTCLVLDGLDQTDQIPRISMGDGDRIMPNENTNCIMVFLDELLDKKVFRTC